MGWSKLKWLQCGAIPKLRHVKGVVTHSQNVFEGPSVSVIEIVRKYTNKSA